MCLANPIKIDQFSINVVQHLYIGRAFPEKHLGAPAERFDISPVFRDQGNYLICQAILAANVA